MTKLRCTKCHHEWIQRVTSKPLACPKCKRYDWEIEQIIEEVNGE